MFRPKDTPEMLKCAHPSPYPVVRVAGSSRDYAALLLVDLAGAVSELTAITQYLYHHFELKGTDDEVAELERCIALVEMHHLDLLAETIRLLGGEPRYRTLQDGREAYWCADRVYYGYSLCDRLTADIAGEWAAVEQYRRHQKEIRDPFVKELIERLITDEYFHIRLLNEALRKHCQPVTIR
ncbi:MAG TPA: ferritin-like domain-containing protein [Spirochaetia bacterium]|nr:ferritin-like domain-containing protein [Spirochaetia bacterium]